MGENWVVYTGTHDNATSTSWWEDLEDNCKRQIYNDHKFSDNPSWNLMEIGMKTTANLFIAPIQDILSLDDASRLNTPGTIGNNWKWKLNKTLEEIDLNLKKFSKLGKFYGRIKD